MKRRSLWKVAAGMRSGRDGWGYSLDSLWMNTASGAWRRMARMASRLALQTLTVARTYASSLVSISFHQPYLAENSVVMRISLTGVQYLVFGYRAATAAAYSPKNRANSSF